MSDIRYRVMEPGEEAAVSALVLSAFDEYIAGDYTPEGVREFRRYASPEAIRERVSQDHRVLVAKTEHGIAGMVEIRAGNHIALLFVDRVYHHQGVARALLRHALAQITQAAPGLERVTVNSARYGVPAYERLGFRQTGPERTVNGIRFIPMARRLDDVDAER